VKCGRVDEFIDETIEQRQRTIASELGYEMTDHCLYMYGICRECRGKSDPGG
jgi:Fur family ferric uptake transcriptional regulator